jgi:hypothetical protein
MPCQTAFFDIRDAYSALPATVASDEFNAGTDGGDRMADAYVQDPGRIFRVARRLEMTQASPSS